MTAFQPTPTMVSVYNLEDAAKLYDKVMAFWDQCRTAMPLDVHNIKYEQLVADAEGQMRQVLPFLGLEWTSRVLSHEAMARTRPFVGTASYAQVVEPLYDRSIGRWKRYREQLKPVLPMLTPWAERMGYEV
jgi:hypothetical protein